MSTIARESLETLCNRNASLEMSTDRYLRILGEIQDIVDPAHRAAFTDLPRLVRRLKDDADSGPGCCGTCHPVDYTPDDGATA